MVDIPIWKTNPRFGIVFTYKCNAKCEECNRYLNFAPWSDSDLTLDDLRVGYEVVVKSGLTIEKVRITGGEPLLHPRFAELMTFINETWNKGYVRGRTRTAVFSNGLTPLPDVPGCRFCVSKLDAKHTHHSPPAISPADLGMEPVSGVDGSYCHRQRGCGRLFDAFGFSFCVFAGPIGRVLGIDPYSPTPNVDGTYEICRHCVFGVGIKKAFKLFAQVHSGELGYPTKTYREGFDRWENDGPPKFKRFQDREAV